mmetsp:Transcript_114632/g.309615  ORF Transcript_114632/g.309615 Transcript_114632/m.309615 type:complete len:759 (+) Transcript_114632:69-2345(+)
MAAKGKGKRGKGAAAEFAPRSIAKSATPGRTLVSDSRVLGCIHEWNPNGFGWAVPLQAISHPQAKVRGGRIYVDLHDVRGGQPLEVGTNIDFVLYKDIRGLGAGDVRALPEGDLPGGGAADEADAGGGAPLPAGWAKIWSEDHERFYYWHGLSKEASWEHPGAAVGAAVGGKGAPGAAAGGLRGEASPLEGWEKHYDTTNKEWYWWNRHTKESSWEEPGSRDAGDEEAADEAAAEDDEDQAEPSAEAKAAAANGAPILAQRRVKGRVAKWQGFFGWVTPEGDLGEGLKHEDKIYLNWREVPEGLDLKVGSEVDFLLFADDNGLGAADVRLRQEGQDDEEEEGNGSGKVKGKGKGKGKRGKGKKGGKEGEAADPLARLERQWAKQDRQLGLAEPFQAKRGQKRKADEEESPEDRRQGPLLPGWEELWSEEHSCYYYWHKATKQAAWERPAMPLDDDGEEEGEEDEQEEEPAPVARGRVSVAGAAGQGSPKRGYQETPAEAAARAMHVVSAGSPASSSAAAEKAPTPIKASLKHKATSSPAKPSPDRWAIVSKPAPNRLKVDYDAPHAGAPAPVIEGLVALRRAGKFCDTAVVSGGSRIPCHRSVLAAGSEELAKKLEEKDVEIQLPGITGEATDFLVRFLYGEVGAECFQPSTPQINSEILQLAFDFRLPLLAELCAARLASDVDTGNVVERIRLCEANALPDLRAALVRGIMQDAEALREVAMAPATLGHPAMMRELLQAVAMGTTSDMQASKRPRTG